VGPAGPAGESGTVVHLAKPNANGGVTCASGEVVIAAYCVGSDNTATPVAVLNDAGGGERNMTRCAEGTAIAYCAKVQ